MNRTYSAAKADDAAEALAKAVEKIKPFMWERGMEGETEYERACIDLWKKLATYRRVTR